MTDQDFDTEGEPAGSANPDIAKLRQRGDKAEQKAKEAEERAAKAERDLAFAKAGLDLSDKKVKYFMAGYDGEMDADKIKAAAVEDGFLPDPEAATEEKAEETHPDQSAFSAMDAATTGANPNDSRIDWTKSMSEIYEAGGGADEVAAFLGKHGWPVAGQGD